MFQKLTPFLPSGDCHYTNTSLLFFVISDSDQK